MKKTLISLALILALVWACTAAADTVSFTDDCGRVVDVPDVITRIVPSGPLPQIILYALAPDMFVGLADEWNESARGIVDPAQFGLPYFGKIYGGKALSIETLALADPQIIIDIGEPKSSSAEDLDKLQMQTAIPAVFISTTLETMPETYRRLGALLGREERAEELAQFCERIYTRTQRIMESVGDNKVKGLYILGENGLNVLARDSYHAELIDMLMDNQAVVENPLSKGTGNEVSMEQIMLWDPDFILFAPDSMFSKVQDDPSFSLLTAVSTGRYLEVPEGPHNFMGMPPSVQRYLGMIWLTAQLYPEYCDYDMKADILEYYRLFYGCALSDAQYDALMNGAILER